MAPVKDVKKIKYFAIREDLTYTEFNDLVQTDLDSKRKFLIMQKTGTNPYPASNGDIWHNYACSLEMIDSLGNNISHYEEEGWKLEFSHFGMTSGYSYTNMWIKFTDRFGFSNSEEKFDISIDGFLYAYARFLKLIKYDGYKYAKLAIENIELKTELEIFKANVLKAEAENKFLKEKLSSFS